MSTLPKLSLLTTLHFSQGLAFGFFTQALPAFLRQRPASLALVGASALLTLPWALKFLWAPFVDRIGSERGGRGRSWILPLQALAVLNLLALAAVDPGEGLGVVAASFVMTNLLAAT